MSPSGSASCRQSSGCWSVRRPKYACRACEDVVVQAPARARLMEGGLPTEATVAQVLVSKYADHPSAVPPGADLRPPGSQAGSLDPGRLGRTRCFPATAGIRTAARSAAGILEPVCRRDDRAGSRSRPRPDQNRPAVCVCARRPAVGRPRPADRRLRLCPRSQGGAAEDRFCARPRRRKASRPPLWPRSGPWRQDG
jgi:hypothetical protein